MYRTGASRRDKLMRSRHNDVYRDRKNPSEPFICRKCGSVFEGGRWTWGKVDLSTHPQEGLCPACRRTLDRIPAGEIHIGGPFYVEHAGEIEHRVRHLEETEKRRRPLERIMSVDRNNGSLFVTTTGVHVAHRIGEGLRRAYKGKLSVDYARDEQNVRVSWQR